MHSGGGVKGERESRVGGVGEAPGRSWRGPSERWRFGVYTRILFWNAVTRVQHTKDV